MEVITTVAAVITALGVIFGLIFAIYRWYLKQENHTQSGNNRSNCSDNFHSIPPFNLQR